MSFADAKLNRLDARATATLWREVRAGAWSVVEEFRRDGRRWVVARRSQPSALASLTRRERDVVARVVAGTPSKVIAIELGLAPSTVAGHLSSAMRKLAARSRVELVRVYRLADVGSLSGSRPSAEPREHSMQARCREPLGLSWSE